jgi:carbon storage regulator
MLVLSRKSGESVWLGSSIEVTVLEVSGDRVKLGFSAPPEVAIQRDEIRAVYPQPCETWQRGRPISELCAL